ncbi:hypothetical protein AB5J55_29915 [Streptomyces sp. R11]|uniref:Uncharacterized protein n=1 Tax=Streptomyces sp. R11 TaxID=3238625 RepID=A0AB39N7X8_9ACTN
MAKPVAEADRLLPTGRYEAAVEGRAPRAARPEPPYGTRRLPWGAGPGGNPATWIGAFARPIR